MSRVKRGVFQPHFSSKPGSRSALRLMKWLVLIALLVLILLALFLPDRGLAAPLSIAVDSNAKSCLTPARCGPGLFPDFPVHDNGAGYL